MVHVKGTNKANPAALAQLHMWLGNFTLPDIDGSGCCIFSDSDFIFILLATMYCTANLLLSIDGKGGPSLITVALLLGKSNPKDISYFVSHRGKVAIDTVDVYKGIVSFLQKVLRSENGSRLFTCLVTYSIR